MQTLAGAVAGFDSFCEYGACCMGKTKGRKETAKLKSFMLTVLFNYKQL